MPKVLLVEDNEMNRDMLSRRLTRNGFEVVVAVDGAQGIAMAASEMPDVILMDMSLPVIDGWEATRLIKADPATRSIPVIALTANAITGDRERCLEGGMNDYIAKPIESTQMAEKVRGWCGRSAQAKTAKPLQDLIEILDDLARRSSNA